MIRLESEREGGKKREIKGKTVVYIRELGRISDCGSMTHLTSISYGVVVSDVLFVKFRIVLAGYVTPKRTFRLRDNRTRAVCTR